MRRSICALAISSVWLGCGSPMMPVDPPPARRDGAIAPGDDAGPRMRRDAGPVVLGDPACGLGNAAFCETFDAPSPGGRGGEIDETRWAFSRWGHVLAFFDRVGAWSRRP